MRTAAQRPFVVVVIQAAPVPLDREATIERACELIVDAGRAGARLIVFPATYIPGYPEWVWTIPANEAQRHRELRATLLANSVDVPGDGTDRLYRIARRARVNVAIGVSERAANGAALYNTILHIGENGDLLGRHRALALASAERLVWTPGDGDTFGAIRYPFGPVGSLIGREHYLPLARHALYASGIRLYLALGQESGDPWLATLRHIAREGQVVAIGCGGMPRGARAAGLAGHGPTMDERAHRGGAIVAPDGSLVGGPVYGREATVSAPLDPAWLLGTANTPTHLGPDARDDIFRLCIDRKGTPTDRATVAPSAKPAAALEGI
jgi:nitrilase